MERLSAAELGERRADFVLLDARDEASFRRGHLEGSGNLAPADFVARRAELPPRQERVLIVASDGEDAQAAAAALEALGYARVAWLDARLASIAPGLLDRGPPARLWRPSPFLQQVLPLLPDPARAPLRALDLAAGAGREAVYLALHGFEVEAWDHDRDVLARAERMASRHGVTIATAVHNLERLKPELPLADRDLVTVFRFLHRPLLPHIARAVRPGGCVVYETYLKGQERFGRPTHPRFLLDPGELARAFADLEILRYQESTPPSGPFMARLVARRPSS